MKKYALDSNCIIDLFKENASTQPAMKRIIEAYHEKKVDLVVSRHTVTEILTPKKASAFVKKLKILPHYPIGQWNEQIASWDQCFASWNNSRENTEKEKLLKSLAKSGNDIRDRGAYIDALYENADAFVTSDLQFAKREPAKRIEEKFGLKILTPKQLSEMINIENKKEEPRSPQRDRSIK